MSVGRAGCAALMPLNKQNDRTNRMPAAVGKRFLEHSVCQIQIRIFSQSRISFLVMTAFFCLRGLPPSFTARYWGV
jgi:hypothetical protein